MNTLITGIGGMVGSHLAEYLVKKGDAVNGTYYKPTVPLTELPEACEISECDVRYFAPLYAVVNRVKPEKIVHLAAQSYPTVSLHRPQETVETNVTGTVNLFEAIKLVRSQHPAYDPTVVVACSSAEYGASLLNTDAPVTEDAPLLPLHPYGVSKVGQDLLTFQYFKSDGLKGVRARIFNTTGPRKVNDVCADFTCRVVKMEKGGAEKTLSTGNLETRRAITDVRDLITALDLLAERGRAGEAYNICGGAVYKMSDIIDIIRAHTPLRFDTRTDPKLLRPTDEPIIVGDSAKLVADTGWAQTWKLEDTIRDMLAYWRRVL